MARYIDHSYEQTKIVPIAFKDQIMPGSFEYTLSYLVDHVIDVSVLDARYCNDEGGRPAYHPALLLKIVLYAYAKGIVSSRKIEEACRTNVMFMALSADTQPHFTTIAGFIATMDAQIVQLFRDVLLYCDKLGLIGKEMFAIDGCKLPSNASTQWSGTKAELRHRKQKLEKAVKTMLTEHRARDRREAGEGLIDREQQYIAKLEKQVKKIKAFLEDNDDNIGPSGKVRKSNITDNDSAKMKTSHGVIQGYNGQSMVDAAHQIVIHAQAYGEGQEAHLLAPMIEHTRSHFVSSGDVFKKTKLLADAGYFSKKALAFLNDEQIDSYIPDRNFRKRDPAFSNAERFRQRDREERRRVYAPESRRQHFTPADFHYDADAGTCVCPAGKRLYRNGSNVRIRGLIGTKFRGSLAACGPCALRERCLRHPTQSTTRQVVFFRGAIEPEQESVLQAMRRKLDTALGRSIYNRRLGTVEPVFANLRNKGLERFTLRGRKKVDTQWKLFNMIHNIEKIHHYGLTFT